MGKTKVIKGKEISEEKRRGRTEGGEEYKKK